MQRQMYIAPPPPAAAPGAGAMASDGAAGFRGASPQFRLPQQAPLAQQAPPAQPVPGSYVLPRSLMRPVTVVAPAAPPAAAPGGSKAGVPGVPADNRSTASSSVSEDETPTDDGAEAAFGDDDHEGAGAVVDRPAFSLDGGFALLKGCVVTDRAGAVGGWTGFSFAKKRPRPGWDVLKLTFDRDAHLWSLARDGRLGHLGRSGWRPMAPPGGRKLRDFLFDNDYHLWAVLPHGEVARWTGYSFETALPKFRKIEAICVDRENQLWALNSTHEIGVWRDGEWSRQPLAPQDFKPTAIAFDAYNQLWAAGTDGMVGVLAPGSSSREARWVILGNVGGWRVVDLTFAWALDGAAFAAAGSFETEDSRNGPAAHARGRGGAAASGSGSGSGSGCPTFRLSSSSASSRGGADVAPRLPPAPARR